MKWLVLLMEAHVARELWRGWQNGVQLMEIRYQLGGEMSYRSTSWCISSLGEFYMHILKLSD